MFKYKNLNDLPLTLSASDISEILGLSKAGTYNLLKQDGFPILSIGKRVLVPREKFLEWMEKNTGEIL